MKDRLSLRRQAIMERKSIKVEGFGVRIGGGKSGTIKRKDAKLKTNQTTTEGRYL